MKKYLLSVGCFLGVMLLLFILMLVVPIQEKIPVQAPTTIRVYNQSLSPKTIQPGSQKEQFDTLFSYFQNMTKVSMFERLCADNTFFSGIKQPKNGKTYAYSNTIQSKGVCMELLFEEKQSLVITIDGNTKKIETKAILFEVKPAKTAYVIQIYFGINNSSTSPQYISSDGNSYPLLTVAKTNKLYNYIVELTQAN